MSLMSAMTRREALGLIAVTATGGTFVAPDALAQSDSLIAASPLLMPDAGVCTIMPQATEGPFYFDPGLERRDITEGKQGVELNGAAAGGRCVLSAAAGCAYRHLALRCPRPLFRLSGTGRRWRHRYQRREVSARRAENGRRRYSFIQDDLSGMVPRSHYPHPFQGLPERKFGHDGPALFSRCAQRGTLRQCDALQESRREARYVQ